MRSNFTSNAAASLASAPASAGTPAPASSAPSGGALWLEQMYQVVLIQGCLFEFNAASGSGGAIQVRMEHGFQAAGALTG
jgi:hypothetical protein